MIYRAAIQQIKCCRASLYIDFLTTVSFPGYGVVFFVRVRVSAEALGSGINYNVEREDAMTSARTAFAQDSN